ncbi:hypothetical protein ABVK25_010318 [Lepraria finkii]|uniref:Uncharacterized protein n=1 Tax=Lepraria finkii TaxID=1340010 RepID=A0ABR4AXM3_9LECA
MADLVLQRIANSHRDQALDPKKCRPKAIVQEILKPRVEPPLLRLPLGKESLGLTKTKAAELEINATAFEKVALQTDFYGYNGLIM